MPNRDTRELKKQVKEMKSRLNAINLCVVEEFSRLYRILSNVNDELRTIKKPTRSHD